MQAVMQQQEMNNVEQTGVTPEEANMVDNANNTNAGTQQVPVNQ